MACAYPNLWNWGAISREQALRLYRRELRNYLLRRLHRRQDADDLTQEVCVRFLSRDDGQRLQKPLAYLYGIAAHVLADHISKESRHADIDGKGMYELSLQLPEMFRPGLDESLNLQQQLGRAFARLPPTHAAVLLAHKQDGLTYEEVAQRLGLSIHTVEKYVTQAKAHLRTMSWDT